MLLCHTKKISGQTSNEVFTETSSIEPHAQANNFLNPLIILRQLKLMKHPHHLLFQGEAPEVQEGHLLYVLEGLLAIVLELSNMFDSPVYRQTLFVSSIPTILLV